MTADASATSYDFDKVIEVLYGDFHDREPTASELIEWLATPPIEAALDPRPCSDEVLRQIAVLTIDDALSEMSDAEHDETAQLEPAIMVGTAAAIAALLNYIAGERRHRESMRSKAGRPDNPKRVSALTPAIVCNRDSDDGQRCGHAIVAVRITKDGQFLVFTCDGTPAHVTVKPLDGGIEQINR
jgi:hypothetical protein